MSADDSAYNIERLGNGDVQIRLGNVMPFEIPSDAAIQMAAIMLKKAGCEVLFRDHSMKVKFPTRVIVGQVQEKVAEKLN